MGSAVHHEVRSGDVSFWTERTVEFEANRPLPAESRRLWVAVVLLGVAVLGSVSVVVFILVSLPTAGGIVTVSLVAAICVAVVSCVVAGAAVVVRIRECSAVRARYTTARRVRGTLEAVERVTDEDGCTRYEAVVAYRISSGTHRVTAEMAVLKGEPPVPGTSVCVTYLPGPDQYLPVGITQEVAAR